MHFRRLLACLLLLGSIATSSLVNADEGTDRWLKYFEGTWKREMKVRTNDDNDWTVTQHTWTAARAAGGHCVVCEVISSDGTTSRSIGSAGVDGKGYDEQGIESSGVYFKTHFPDASGDTMTGTLEAHVPDYEGTGKGTITIKRKDENSYFTEWNVTFSNGTVMKGEESNTRIANEKTTSREDFQKLAERLEGRWGGDITFIADWPGQDLGQGDRVIAYNEFTRVLDQQSILGRESAGNQSNIVLLAWNPVSKKIELTITTSSGGDHQAVMWKDSDDTYGWRLVSGGTIDGKAMRGNGFWVFLEDDSVLMMHGNVTLDGEALKPYRDMYKRLSPK